MAVVDEVFLFVVDEVILHGSRDRARRNVGSPNRMELTGSCRRILQYN